MKKFLVFLLFVILLGCSTSTAGNNSYFTDKYGWNDGGGLNQTFLGRGINMGNYLEGVVTPEFPLGEGSWSGGRRIQTSDFDNIVNKGFKTVRIPVRWSAHAEMQDEDNDGSMYEIDGVFMDRVIEVVEWALNAGLKVVLNVHHYEEMMKSPENMQAYHQARLFAFWNQICDQFSEQDFPVDKVVFELLNEPNGTIGYEDWNSIVADLTDLIWNIKGQSNRKIMVGTANWGGVPGLKRLKLPSICDNTNTIITVHYYEPFRFTHQGASWVEGSDKWIGTPWLGRPQDLADLRGLLYQIESWNTMDFEIFLGEFGVYSKYSAPKYQKAWTAFIARESEKRNFSWAYWEYSSGFGAYDPVSKSWREQLISALIPNLP